MGIEYTEKDLYAHVLAMEQIMSTGGGWQDQVGGITPGLKYITSMPGIDQQLKVTHVDIPEFAKRELDDLNMQYEAICREINKTPDCSGDKKSIELF